MGRAPNRVEFFNISLSFSTLDFRESWVFLFSFKIKMLFYTPWSFLFHCWGSLFIVFSTRDRWEDFRDRFPKGLRGGLEKKSIFFFEGLFFWKGWGLLDFFKKTTFFTKLGGP